MLIPAQTRPACAVFFLALRLHIVVVDIASEIVKQGRCKTEGFAVEEDKISYRGAEYKCAKTISKDIFKKTENGSDRKRESMLKKETHRAA